MKLFKEPCTWAKTAMITNIQHFSLHDGPGIRTTIFFKGCNLRCAWCHNPETISPTPQIGIDRNLCIGCRACEEICPLHLHHIRHGEHIYNHSHCNGCAACVDVCPTKALTLYGREVPLLELLDKCIRDRDVFPKYGGVTFSGGECLLQPQAVYYLAEKLNSLDMHVCIDTALNIPWGTVERLIPVTNLFLVDIKAGTEKTHKRYTGVTFSRILDNLQRLTMLADCWIRIPVIHGVNDTKAELDGMVKIIAVLGPRLQGIQLLPYNSFGESKYDRLSQVKPFFEPPKREGLKAMQMYLEETGVPIVCN